jgi:hypothetical protein
MMVSGASKKKNRAGGLRSCNKPKEEWLGSSKVLGLLRSDLKSALFIFDLQHNKIIEENIGGISWNMSDSLVVRDTSIYATGVFMDPDRYSYPAPDKRDIDFFHLGTSVLDLNNNNNNKKWKEFAKMPPSTGTLQRPSSPILGHNIYVFQGTKALVYDINKDKWENLSHPPELLESRKSIIASYGRPLSRPELDSIQDPITIRHPVISDTINNRLLVNFWYDLYAYYPDNEHGSKWECLTRTKLGTPTICFRRPALVFDCVVYFYFPKQENSPYCIDAYDLTTNKPINVLWSDDFHTHVYNDSLAQLARLDCFGYDTSRITLAHLGGGGIMCLASCSQDDNSSTCIHFLRFRVQRLASLEEGVLITPVTAHQFTLPTCYRRVGHVIPL